MPIETVTIKYSKNLDVAINYHKKVILVDVLMDTLLRTKFDMFVRKVLLVEM